MKRLLVILAALLGATPAFAADLKPLPTPFKAAPLVSSPGCQWCGLYFGVSAGYGGADFIANFDDSRDLTSLSAKHSANSLLGGAHLGYNYQFGMIVLGAETDISLTGIKDSANGVETTLPWLGTTRLRAGFLVTSDFLFYGTGGAAYGHVKVGDLTGSNMVFTTPTVGWTLGGGAEYQLASNIRIGAEYLHVDLDGPSVTNGLRTLGTRVPVDIARGRLSYSF
jgi:outer membrane immunogenic protein